MFRFIQALVDGCGPGKGTRYSDSLRAGRSGDRIPMEARFSAPVQTTPEAKPRLLHNGDQVSFRGGGGAPGRRVHHPPPPSAEGEVTEQLNLYHPPAASWPVAGRNSSQMDLYTSISIDSPSHDHLNAHNTD